jgi:hypothetical protein
VKSFFLLSFLKLWNEFNCWNVRKVLGRRNGQIVNAELRSVLPIEAFFPGSSVAPPTSNSSSGTLIARVKQNLLRHGQEYCGRRIILCWRTDIRDSAYGDGAARMWRRRHWEMEELDLRSLAEIDQLGMWLCTAEAATTRCIGPALSAHCLPFHRAGSKRPSPATTMHSKSWLHLTSSCSSYA